ncbi:MAG: bifunctional diguanylate cyclase/phosphodiesterase, partial [Clostridiales bacterium]|nr:bifunctional diguanylate cyclase/phosphodiesterase [Candidatus Blautia equi]
IMGALAASQHISKPIRDVQQEVLDAGSNIIPELSRTGVREVDDLASAITGLSQRVVNSSKRFLSIMEMSSIEMGGYEVDEKNDFLFITENFFLLFNRRDLIPSEMTVREFLAVIRELKEQLQPEQITMNSRLYTIRDQAGLVRYIHVQESKVDGRMIGVAEDVTIQTIEKKHIEHERDYDMLTGLYNRRAFIHDAQKLVEKPSELGLAIAVMIDLDDLKLLNDTYGHEWGDLYIASCSKCIQKSCAVNSICARVSGDEFNILMYGFRDRAEAGKAMERLWKRFADTVIRFPDGKEHSISASGGYVFLRDDVRDIMEYIKYADFAMYEIKRGKKGGFREFDPGQYLANENEKEKHSIFRQIVSGERIHYVFQPIISARTGNIYGCEALMRIMDSEGMNLAEFLRIAREEDALGDVEHLTWFNALPAFLRLVEQNLIPREAKLFINSQVSHMLSEEEQKYLIEEYGEIRDNVVMEVLETDELAIDFSVILQQTQELFAREYALDDYGTGYNSEKNLISLMPKYIKIDIALIRDVEKYQERQKLITGLLSFAHEKNMLVLAEGVETMAELHCLLTMGVDMFQGYLFARPSDTPNVLNKEAMDMVKSFMISEDPSRVQESRASFGS